MKALILSILIITTLNTFSQNVSRLEERPGECCQHYDEEYGETWTILFFAKDKLDAQRLESRYKMFDIANDFFESNGDYYIELVDPSDTLEYLTMYKLPLFTNKMKSQLIYIDFLITEKNEPLYDSEGNKIMFR
jgi:hypothetical protein